MNKINWNWKEYQFKSFQNHFKCPKQNLFYVSGFKNNRKGKLVIKTAVKMRGNDFVRRAC
jgi:hypothetical protein